MPGPRLPLFDMSRDAMWEFSGVTGNPTSPAGFHSAVAGDTHLT
jgi:hypothetical protein